PKPKSPDAALHSIHVRPGFQVELMAAEPLVLDPIAFEFGPDGRLWVVEMGDYPLGPSGGQIRCLEDTDGDGKYDKATVFLDVPYPTGVLPWGNGVLVTAAPNVLYAEDADGDGKADKQEILYSGFAEGNPQHRVNGLVRGLDNWLYIANGDSGGTIESTKTGKKVNISGRDLRIRPETGDLDAVAGQTQFGRSRDDWGNWFGCNNSNPMYQYVLDDAYQRRNPYFAGASGRIDVPEVAGNAPVFPISPLLERFNDYHTANRFTSACSVMVYRDDLFGPHFAGNAFICEPVHNLINRQIVSPKRVLFSSKRAPDEEQSEFLASRDNWFRPTTVKAGPDGALWIADMYRHVIEHPQWIPDTWQKKLDLRAGHDQGRIYRVYPVDKKPRSIPRLDKLDTAGLVAALDSPSGWQRDTTQQLLVARKDKSAVPLLESQASTSRNPLCRLHALATLAGFATLSETILIKALDDEHPGVRRHALSLVETLPGNHSQELLAAVFKRTGDPDPHVRLQTAYTLGQLKGDAAAAAIGAMLVSDGNDRFLFSALMSSVNKSNVEGVLTKVLASSSDSGKNQNLIINLLDLAAALGNDQALVRLMQSVTQDRDGRFEAWQYSALARLLDSLSRRNESLIEKIKKAKDAGADKLLAAVDRLFDSARWVAVDDAAEIEARRGAVRLLGRGRDQHDADLQLLDRLLAPQMPSELQQEVLAELGRLRQERVPEIILTRWRGFVPQRRTQALDVLMSRDAWAAELMAAIADKRIARTDFDAARRQRLLEHRSLDVRQKAAAAFAADANTDRQKV
ncbi:MAG TPA: PVC-type heme-binding CxxCH protein, partial [Planctomycetaceae bacterium]